MNKIMNENENLNFLEFDPKALCVVGQNNEFENSYVTNVYLAGKIEPNGWRQKIIDIRNNFFGEEKDKIRNGITIKYNDHINITGPFFLSCDHSCYHGNNSHGVGLSSYNDCYGLSDHFTEDEVKHICLEQIKKSDVIFAYINDDTCYGTLYELGFAAALNKPILLLFDSNKRRKNMWFIANGAKMAMVQDKYTGIKENFDYMIGYYEKFNK